MEPVAYDRVKLIIVRSGSAIVFSEFGQQPVTVGDVVVRTAGPSLVAALRPDIR